MNPAAGGPLKAAQQHIAAALKGFPENATVIAALVAAAAALDEAAAALDAPSQAVAGHRLARKRREMDAALLLAAGIRGSAWVEPSTIAPGGSATLRLHVADVSIPMRAHPVATGSLEIAAGIGGDHVMSFVVTAPAAAELSTPYPASFGSLGGNGALYFEIEAEIGGRRISAPLDLEEPLQIAPRHSVEIDPPALILPLPASGDPLAVGLRIAGPPAEATLVPTDGFAVSAIAGGFALRPEAGLTAGRHRLPVTVDGRPGYRQTAIAYPHIGRTRFVQPAALDVLALQLELPAGARIGYVGGGSDNVETWLRGMGLDVTALGPADLAGDLGGYTTLVVGIFAFGLRPDLAAATGRLHDWVRAGGHLVTLYHRPSDGWAPEHTPPARLVIGAPSLRWRVTDPTAAVSVLAPEHPLLTRPNRIGPDDWGGWDKERGLYFAAEWADAYVPLLAMSDRGEAPLRGSLLSAPIGRGRHTHTSLVLHHQLDRMVPGAFRLMANLVQPAW